MQSAPDDSLLATGSTDETISCWETESRRKLASLRAPRHYEGMNISAATGISATQRRSLLALGAIDF